MLTECDIDERYLICLLLTLNKINIISISGDVIWNDKIAQSIQSGISGKV